MSNATTGSYKDYEMIPAEHIRQAERMAEISADVNVRDGVTAQVYATLALAHATIAQAQMQGAMRA